MSWDIAFWRGRPNMPGHQVLDLLDAGTAVDFVTALDAPAVRAAFVEEYAGDLRLSDDGAGRVDIQGRGFEGSLRTGDRLFYVMCDWAFAQDEDLVVKLVRAGRRAGLTAFDPQSYRIWHAPLTPSAADIAAFDVDDCEIEDSPDE